MKAYVTGTTRGLGRAIVHALEQRGYASEVFNERPSGYEIVGLNRPEFDLVRSTSNHIKNDFDLYVINAHAGFENVELLYDLFEANKDRECQIVIIGSVSADGDRAYVNRYAVEKAAIDKAATQLQLIDSACRVSVVKPGRMETEMTDHRKEYYRMDPKIIAETVLWVASQPPLINVKTISIDVHNSNRKI